MYRIHTSPSGRQVRPNVADALNGAPHSGTAHMSARIFPFLPRRWRHCCASCGASFLPRAAHHRLCRVCFLWDRALTHFMVAEASFRELRAGGRR